MYAIFTKIVCVIVLVGLFGCAGQNTTIMYPPIPNSNSKQPTAEEPNIPDITHENTFDANSGRPFSEEGKYQANAGQKEMVGTNSGMPEDMTSKQDAGGLTQKQNPAGDDKGLYQEDSNSDDIGVIEDALLIPTKLPEPIPNIKIPPSPTTQIERSHDSTKLPSPTLPEKNIPSKPIVKLGDEHLEGEIHILVDAYTRDILEKCLPFWKKMYPKVKTIVHEETETGLSLDKDPISFSVTKHGEVIAIDAVAIVVHKNNLLESIQWQDMLDVFTGKTTDWLYVGDKMEGTMKVYSLPSSTLEYQILHKKLPQNQELRSDIDWVENDALLNEIEQLPFAIGFIRQSYLQQHPYDVKILKLLGNNQEESLQYNVMLSSQATDTATKAFVQFMQNSPDIKKNIEAMGYQLP